MVKAKKAGKTVRCFKAIILKVKNTELVTTVGTMEANISETGMKIKSMGMAHILGSMEGSTREIG